MELIKELQLTAYDVLMDRYSFIRHSDEGLLVYKARYGRPENEVLVRADICLSPEGNILNVVANYTTNASSAGVFIYLHDMLFNDIDELDYLLSHQAQIRQHLLRN